MNKLEQCKAEIDAALKKHGCTINVYCQADYEECESSLDLVEICNDKSCADSIELELVDLEACSYTKTYPGN